MREERKTRLCLFKPGPAYQWGSTERERERETETTLLAVQNGRGKAPILFSRTNQPPPFLATHLFFASLHLLAPTSPAASAANDNGKHHRGRGRRRLPPTLPRLRKWRPGRRLWYINTRVDSVSNLGPYCPLVVHHTVVREDEEGECTKHSIRCLAR